MSDRLRIAWFSDLPVSGVAHTTSAYVSKLLLPRLTRRFDIELFHNSFSHFEQYPTYHCLTAIKRHRKQPYDIFFYQLEDSPFTQWCRIHCGLMPGIQLAHDFLFTSFGPEPILNSPWKAIHKRLHNPAAPWPTRSDEQYQNGPHAIREASYAAAQLFSQPAMASECARLSECSVGGEGDEPLRCYLPLPVAPDLFATRTPTMHRILFCGSPWIQHRAHKVLHAVAEFDSAMPVHWLLDQEERPAAEELIREFGADAVTLETGRTVQRWSELVSEGGIALHTLFSVYGQTGPYLAVSLAAGVPVIVTRFGHSEQLPDSLVFKVQPGDTEAVEIKAIFDAICNGGIRPSVDLQQDFARELHSADSVAAELGLVFENQADRVAACMSRWETLKGQARSELLAEARSLTPAGAPLADEWERLESVYKEFQW